MKLNWTTKEGNVINLYDYKDKNHIKNILKILEKQLINKPEIDLEISWSDSDWAYSADQCIINEWNKYNNYRNWLKNYINKIKKLI